MPVRIRPLTSFVSESVGERRFVMLMLGGFSLVALILAAVGIFGVVSYSVAQRTREMPATTGYDAPHGSLSSTHALHTMGAPAESFSCRQQ